MTRTRIAIATAAAGLLVGLLSVVRVPAGGRAIVSWRGGGTPALVPAGLHLRLPFLQRVQRFSAGALAVEGEIAATSREGSSLTLPYRVEVRPSDQDLLVLHGEGGAGGVRRGLAAAVEVALLQEVASASLHDLAAGAALETIRGQLARSLADRFGAAARVNLSPPRIPPEVQASFDRQAIFGKRRETGARIVLVGLDGADWDVIDPMIARGELPNLSRLKRQGAWARMRSNVPTLSPLLWTTVATGKAPDRHGINDFLVLDPRTGRRVPINSTFRKARAIWNILSEAGLENDIIAWWATWPAESIAGHLISDRVAYSTWEVGRAEALRGLVHPPGYAAEASRLRVREESIPYSQAARLVHVSEGEFRQARAAAARKGTASELQETINVLVRVLASTETYRKIALDLLDSRARAGSPARLFAVYFQGIDEVSHRTAHCAPPRSDLCPEGDYRRLKDAVAGFYRYQDEILGEILGRASGATVIVMSDHGFAVGDERPRDEKPFIEGKPGLWHNMAGILLIAGPSTGSGEMPTVTLYDVAPTLLALLGLAVPEDMQGKVLDGALSPGFLASFPVVRIPTYEPLPGPVQASGGGTGPGAGPAGEATLGAGGEEMVEQLRSLGYIGGGEVPAGGAPPETNAGADPGTTTTSGIPTVLYHANLATVHLGKRQYDRAEAEYRKALRIDPASPQALMGLAALHEAKGEPGKALEILETLEGLDPEGDGGPLVKMADLFIRIDRAADGVAFMKGIEKRRATGDRREVGYRVALGNLLAAAGRPAEAEREYLRALSHDPVSITAMQEMFGLYDGQGRAADLEPRLRDALTRSPRSPMHHNWLGLVLKRRNDLRGAEAEFRKALEYAPGLAGATANLGSLYLQEGRVPEAVTLLRQVVDKDPRSVESRTNLIVALGMSGDLDGARREFEKGGADGAKIPLYYNALAYALHLNGRSEEALSTLRESLRIDPRQPDALRLRAEIERGGP